MADIFPPDYTTDVGRLRVLINDTEQHPEYATGTDTTAYLFSDDQLGVYLSVFETIYFAAAACIDMLATNEALVSKKIKTEDLQTDGASVANALRLHAQALRTEGQRLLDQDIAVEISDFQIAHPWWEVPVFGGYGQSAYSGPGSLWP
jgi:hypothetical protein